MDDGGAGGPSRRAQTSTRGTVTAMGSGTMFRKLGVAVVATAFTALVGITAASAASTTSGMTTTQGGGAGTGGSAGTGASGNMGTSASSSHQSQCDARADKRHLTGD